MIILRLSFDAHDMTAGNETIFSFMHTEWASNLTKESNHCVGYSKVVGAA